YQFVETKAPTGYELDSTPIKFTIEKGQTKAAAVVAENVKKKVEPVNKPADPTAGPNTKHTLANTATNIFNTLLAGAVLLITGTVLLLISRRKKSYE
ncbi:SpaA isopeptide-forming pilin-related protein, partial [Neobacillus drentensis]|uniref:MSCRAMM family protein n=1 Tax=Neobacillus drentensis TaxID=220684 RepID=UPI003000213D